MNATSILGFLAQAAEPVKEAVKDGAGSAADPTSWTTWLPAVVIAIVGGVLLALLSRWAGRAVGKHWGQDRGKLIRKVVLYLGWFVLVMAVLNQLGFKLTAVLGAAGIAGIAVGFAAQTSLSNVISGVFLLTEKPFKAGDMIQIGDTMGVCLSVDLLSVKLRTFDNKFVRIPNETLIKAQVTNYSRFPIRRVDLKICVAYKEDLERVKALLLGIAREHPLALNEPEPLCFCSNFADSAVELIFVVWATGEDFLKLKDALMINIKKRFEEEGIEIPFPHISLYAGSASGPLPLELSADAAARLGSRGKRGKK